MEQENHVSTDLRVLLAEFYPFIIQESVNGPFQIVPSLHSRIAGHERCDSLMAAIVRDQRLTKFFPALGGRTGRGQDIDSLKDLQTIVVWSDGSSEGMTPLTLSAAIIGDVFRYLWSWGDNPSLDDALERLPDSIELARNLAEKRTVRIPAVVSIHNIGLIGGRTIKIGSAVLRKPIRYDRSRLFAIAPGQDINVVLRLETDFSAIHIRATSRAANRDEEQQKTQHLIETLGYKCLDGQIRRLQDAVDRARLSVVLSSPPGKIFSPVQGWDSVVNPLSDLNHAQISGARSLKSPYPTQKIGRVAERQIARLSPLIEGHSDVLRAGIRRLLLAITERLYPEDGFVDAVICWENLFSGTPETSLRVCGSMAKLLSRADNKRRRDIYRDLTKLYNERNKVVHGSSQDVSQLAPENRDLAISYALDAFRAIYQRDDLLGIKDSPKRGLAVLLGP